MNIDFTVTLIIIIINVALALIIMRNNISQKSNMLFILFLMFLIAWKLTLYLYLSAPSEDMLLVIGRANFAVSSLMVYFAFKFSEAFADENNPLIKSKLVNRFINIATLLAVIISLFTPLVSQNEIIVSGEKQTIFGDLYWLYFLHLILILLLTLVSLYRKVRITNDYSREQAKLILGGFLFAAVFGVTTNIIFPYIFNTFSLQEIGPLGTITISIAVTISIIRYRFLDTRVVLANILHLLIMSAFAYFVFFILGFIYLEIFHTLFTLNIYIISIFVALAFATLYELLGSLIKDKIESPLIYGKIKPEEIIAQLNIKMSTNLDLHSIMVTTHNLIKDYWGNENTYIVIKIQDHIEIYPNSIDRNQKYLEIILRNLTNNIRDIVIIDSTFIDTFFHPLDTEEDLKKVANFIVETKLKLLAPLYFSNELMGMIVLGDRKDNVYNSADSDTLKSIASLIALSVNRAKLFSEVQEFNKTLQIKIDQATSEVQSKNLALEEQLRKEKDMMDILSHELRTPLSIARNAILMMKTAIDKVEDEKPLIELNGLLSKATESIRREVKILETVLSSTRIENNRLQINFEKVDLNDVINDTIDGNKIEAAKKGLKVYSILPNENVYVYGGRDQVQEIVDNLVSNSIKYTTTGEIRIELNQESKFGLVTIIDTGEGIPESEIPNLGKKFYRVNPYLKNDSQQTNIIRPGGTGIGLYVVFKLVQMMKGEMSVKSKYGQGSAFTVKLPLYSYLSTSNPASIK